MTPGSSEEKWKIRKNAGHLVVKLEFSKETKVCLQSFLNGTLHDLLCKQGMREENLDHLLDFVTDLAEISIKETGSVWSKAVPLIAKIVKKSKKFIFENFMDPLCPREKPDADKANIRPMKIRRQFGVTDTLHTLKIIFCDPTVLEGYAEEMQKRYRKTFTAWTPGVLGKAWCCLINGEWHSIMAGM